MRRFFVLIIILMISTLACGLITTVTPNPTSSSQPIPVIITRAPTNSPTSEPAGTQPPVAVGTQPPGGVNTPTTTQEEPTKTPYPTSVLDAALSTEINLIQTQVIAERELQPKHPVPVVLLSPDQVRQNEINDYQTDYSDEEAADDIYELSIIGLVNPDFDIRTFMVNLYSEQIAGFYDPEVSEMFVVQGQGFEGPERVTYAHEYTHVLQDQNYDLRHGLNYNDDACEVDTERCAAVQALVEGDATLSEIFWFQNYATRQDIQQYLDFANNLKQPVYDSAPAFLKEDFVFPYVQGLTFVQTIHDQGGWSAIDAVYHNPPVSTEQILHPSLYPSDTPIKVDLADLASALGSGWREVSRNQMGEWYTYLILARGVDEKARLDDKTAQAAAAGWGGDEYLVLHNDAAKTTAFVMKTVWDTTSDAAEFSTSLQKYANTRFGASASQQGDTFSWTYQGGYSSFYVSGDTTIWIIAPDATVAGSISNQVQP
jgi:hypothetical protein